MKRLEALLDQKSECIDWVGAGKIPNHFKRLSVTKQKAFELALYGFKSLVTYYPPKEAGDVTYKGIMPYFSQCLIAGAILSGEFDKITICTPSQYGKSWLLGHIGLIKASRGDKTYIAGYDAGDTDIIMNNAIQSVLELNPEVQLRLMDVKKNDLNRLAQALNKQNIKFSDAGSLETVSLGETYSGIKGNRMVGRAGDTFVDEAAKCSREALAELGRGDFASVEDRKLQSIYISNPHATGDFYDRLTEENPNERSFILWMDALTAVEEERWTKNRVLTSEFAKRRRQRTVYLMCELEQSGFGMFDEPVIDDKVGDTFFLGVDAAYKGKDNISLCLASYGEKLHINEIVTMDKSNWIDGVTSEQIIDEISRIVGRFRVQRVCVDIGWGAWLVEGLNRRGIPALGVNFASSPTKSRKDAKHYSATNASNKRAEMHLDLQDLIEHQNVTFSKEVYEKISDVLPYVVSERKGRTIQIHPKSEIKAIIGKSPDEFDSVLLAIHAFILWLGNSEEFIT